jgi:hypothetical protein
VTTLNATCTATKRARRTTGSRKEKRPTYSPTHKFDDSSWHFTQEEVETLLLGTDDYVKRTVAQENSGTRVKVSIAEILSELRNKGGPFATFANTVTTRKGGTKKISDRVRYEVSKQRGKT